ncbi:MAG TPA: Arc family DNA-binding protein [Gemmatimonadales bacterium]|nr:Arc family DNA-binding protein [Gemmatimonadales bacterium]
MHGARGTNQEAVFTLRLDREKLEQLREVAHSEHRSIVAHLRVMVDREIAAYEAGEERAAA